MVAVAIEVGELLMLVKNELKKSSLIVLEAVVTEEFAVITYHVTEVFKIDADFIELSLHFTINFILTVAFKLSFKSL